MVIGRIRLSGNYEKADSWNLPGGGVVKAGEKRSFAVNFGSFVGMRAPSAGGTRSEELGRIA